MNVSPAVLAALASSTFSVAGPSSSAPSSSTVESSLPAAAAQKHSSGRSFSNVLLVETLPSIPSLTATAESGPNTGFAIDPLEESLEQVVHGELAVDDERVEDREEADPAAGDELSYAVNNNQNGLGIIEEHVDSGLCLNFKKHGYCALFPCYRVHGDQCVICGMYCMDPYDIEQHLQHSVECFERLSIAKLRSKDKTCGICLEVVMEKPIGQQQFGILPNCNHIFCLECIGIWRKTKRFTNRVKLGCPVCRTASYFVCPSKAWVEIPEEKNELIDNYFTMIFCQHIKQGWNKCPFANKPALTSWADLVDVGELSRTDNSSDTDSSGSSIYSYDSDDSEWSDDSDDLYDV